MKSISSGHHTKHLLFYCYNGDLYGVGVNEYGQLGLGKDIRETNEPILLKNDKNIKSICLGGDYTFILHKNGDLFSFGYNRCGQLGIGNTKNQYEPVLVMNDPTIKSISCGEYHTMIYKENGELYVFGSNYEGQLGIGNSNIEIQSTPILLMVDKTIKMIRLGSHSIIYKENGDLFVFGYNENGQLGLGDIKIDRYTPTLLLNDIDIEDIDCGNEHTVYYKKNGEIYVF